MDSERCQLLCEGFLDIKYPPDSPERLLQKAWRKLWASAMILYPRTRGEPHLLLQFRKGPNEKRLHVVKATRDGLRLFRCRSKSRRLRTWALSSGSSLLVYLAAPTEYETQKWMQTLRDGLWPPIHNLPDSAYEVSLIDDEKTFSTGLLGLYGRLVRTSDDVVSIIHPHWQGMLLRWKQDDVEDVRLIRKVGDEASSAGVFKITLRSPGLKTRSHNFYSSTAALAVGWIQSKTQISEKLDTNNPQKTNESPVPHVEENQNEMISKTESEYAEVRKISKQLEIIEEDTTTIVGNGLNEEEVSNTHPGNHLLANISSDLLNASINSIRPARQKFLDDNTDVKSAVEESDSDDSLTDIYEHVYEDLPPRTASIGNCTLYEEIVDLDNEYVPPLPPQLPNRPIQKPNSLRLLKLSESVAEALKLAEEMPVKVEQQQHTGFLKKVVGKCKSLQASPLRETAQQSFEEQPVLKRTTSEPDVTLSSATKDIWFPDSIDRRKTTDDILSDSKSKEEPTAENFLRLIKTPIPKQDIESNSKINPMPFDRRLHNNVSKSKDKATKCISKETEGEYINMR